MSRQPIAGAGAAVRTPSGAAAARPPVPSLSPSSPLPPQRYRALRARYNALLVTLYERTSLTLREIAALAGRTDRAVQMLVRALACRPRNAKTCRPGTDVGLRREGARPPPLNAPATRRVAAAFAAVARELAASADAQAASELQRAAARAKQRAARTQTRVIASAARELTHLAAAIEDTAAIHAPKQPSRLNLRRAQERAAREQEARMWEAHAAARRAKPPSHPSPASGGGMEREARPSDRDAGRRGDGIAERARAERRGAEPRPGPRIRALW